MARRPGRMVGGWRVAGRAGAGAMWRQHDDYRSLRSLSVRGMVAPSLPCRPDVGHNAAPIIRQATLQ